MQRLLTLTRAARLVGIPRGALQKKIKKGELPTFEGMVTPEDLLQAYPEAHIEDNAVLERMEKIKDEAFSRRVREHILPDAEVLAARLAALSKEHTRTRTALDRYRLVFERLESKLLDVERDKRGLSAPESASLRNWLRDELSASPPTTALQRLAFEESFLRIMAAQVQVLPSRHEFFVEGNSTILDAGLRCGLALNYGCSDGTCGRCKARIVSGEIRQSRDHEYAISPSEKQQGYALLCANTAITDLVIEVEEAHAATDIPRQQLPAWVRGIKRPTEDIIVLRLQTPGSSRLRFLAGQSVTLSVGETLFAEHPVASCPCDESNLQFHIPRAPRGDFSEYLFNGLKRGDVLTVSGPHGSFVLKENSPNRVVFLAWDTGFAPIKGLIEHAMALEVAESMDLYWAVAGEGRHYFHNLCRSWSDALDNFEYHPIVTADTKLTEPSGRVIEHVADQVCNNHVQLADFDVYVAGPPAFTAGISEILLARGLPPEQLVASDTLA